jgi:hypothetical protein
MNPKTKIKTNNITINQHHIQENAHKQNKRTTSTYFGQETKQITKIFKDSDTRIGFRTTSTIQKHLQQKQQRKSKYDNSSKA